MIKRLVLWILIIAALVGITGCSSNNSADSNTAADFTVRGLDGKAVTFSQMRGHPILLNFWATWCPPCRAEMPFLDEIYRDKQWSDRGLVIMAISSGEPEETIAQYVKENGLFLPVYQDITHKVSNDYRIQYLPTTFFIDKNGIIKSIKIGAFASKQEIESGLARITQ
ncbi:MAG: TlpA disulfide reductase family protein [Dehalococcoidales bacterium]|nr:TlpA disulfide reductase family protein [Dehalococcoidales bacterium]